MTGSATTGLEANGVSNVPLDDAAPDRAGETADSDQTVAPNPDSWRAEVAARLERYRTRRKPRTPRYPSLLLPFDAPESWSRPSPPADLQRTALTGTALTGTGSSAVAIAHAGQNLAFQTEVRDSDAAPVFHKSHSAPQQDSYQPEPAKVIEFPRSAAIPVFHASELADPVFDRPRIVEAPEILPPPPALGGMLIEPAPTESADRQSDSAALALPASIGRRTLAALLDGGILAASLAAFTAIFLRLNPSLNPRLNLSVNLIREYLPAFATLAGVAILLWIAYEFLFVVYTGSTPGLRATHLQLASFDGASLNCRSRRWRVLASFLSAFSAGLGYLWCILDQDGLCWHDRITRTYVQSAPKAE